MKTQYHIIKYYDRSSLIGFKKNRKEKKIKAIMIMSKEVLKSTFFGYIA
ncbi:MAG: hypothetical protein ACK4F9_04010 [Brevinematia bacterium]